MPAKPEEYRKLLDGAMAEIIGFAGESCEHIAWLKEKSPSYAEALSAFETGIERHIGLPLPVFEAYLAGYVSAQKYIFVLWTHREELDRIVKGAALSWLKLLAPKTPWKN